MPKGASDAELDAAIRGAALKAFDVERVMSGDRVVIVAALNSDEPYPATTHPAAIRVLAEMLEERGARVSVANQSGIEYVLQGPRGVVRGSSAECYRKSGMARSGATFVGCEELGWERGFRRFDDARAAHWPRGFHLTRFIDEADHVVIASRVSAHAQGGVTLGLKNLVGLLREDSRLEFHSRGPMNWFVRLQALGSGIHARRSASPDFFEKVAEIALAVQDKLLGELLVATQLQTTMGPNAHLMMIAGLGVLASHVHTPSTGLIIASADLVAADAVALAFLIHGYRQTPLWPRLLQKVLVAANGQIPELGEEGVYQNRFLRHALRLGLGKRVSALETEGVPPGLKKLLEDELFGAR